jgi:hypothetical protein
VNYTLRHSFDATIEELERAILDDPRFFDMLSTSCESLESVTLLTQKDQGGILVREVAYTPKPRIPRFAQRWITKEMVSWVELSRYDRAARRFTYEIRPNIPHGWRDRFSSTGQYVLVAEGARTSRTIEGEIAVRAALVGGIAERFLVGEVKKTFDQEARALSDFVTQRRAA